MTESSQEQKNFLQECIFLIWDFVTKKYDLDKKLNDITEKKFRLIEKKNNQDSKKKKPGNIFLGAGYFGKLNKSKQPHGSGSFIYQNEDFYLGDVKDGLKQGIGKYTYLGSKDVKYHPFSIPYYIGEWHADSYDGIGKKYITDNPNLMIYEGNFCNNSITGFGTYKQLANDKIVITEMIGYFLDGLPLWYIIEIHRDNKGNFLTKKPTTNHEFAKSGLYLHDIKNGTKNLIFPLYESDWKIIENRSFKHMKPEKNKHVIQIYKTLYKNYFKLEIFSKGFKEKKLKLKKNLYKTMIETEKYFWKNMKNKDLNDLIIQMNNIFKSFSSISKINEFKEIQNEIDICSKKFKKLRVKLLK